MRLFLRMHDLVGKSATKPAYEAMYFPPYSVLVNSFPSGNQEHRIARC